MFETKRVYETPSPDDGSRILIDRLWPRGVGRETARIADWRKELAPSEELRNWYSHDPAKFPRFRERYRTELFHHLDALARLVMEGERGRVTLVYAAKDAQRCNAKVLKELLLELSTESPGSAHQQDPLGVSRDGKRRKGTRQGLAVRRRHGRTIGPTRKSRRGLPSGASDGPRTSS